MSEFHADPLVGGDDSYTTDDDNPTTGLGNGGFWTRLVPMFRNVVAIANYVRQRASEVAQASQIASGAAQTAVDAANTATAKVAFVDTAPVVQSATDSSKRLRFALTIPTNVERVLTVPLANGTIATQEHVTERLALAQDTQKQRQKRHATALSF